jgi:hypothetical protein
VIKLLDGVVVKEPQMLCVVEAEYRAKTNRHLSPRMLADEVQISKDTVRRIVVEDLRKRKICSHFVPHSLTPEQKDRPTT